MTLAELLDLPGTDGIKTVLLWFLQRNPPPVTDWEVGGVLRTQLEIEGAVIGDLIEAIEVQIAGGFLELSEGEWLALLAHGWYAVEQGAAAPAQQTATLTCDAAHGPYTITTRTALVATDGSRYFPIAGGTLATSGSLALNLIAESPGAARGLVTRLATPLAGVAVTLPAIRIVSTVPQYGADQESDGALQARCFARWPSLEASEEDRLAKWAKAASASVTRLRLDADQVNPGGVIVTLAGASGGVSGGVVTTVQSYVDARAAITDYITAQTASDQTVTAGGTVTVPAARLVEIQLAADEAWVLFLATTQIGGQVHISQLIKVIMDAGAIDFTDVTLNAVGADLTLGDTEVPVPDAGGLATLLTWETV